MPDEHGCSSGHDDMDEAIEQSTPWDLLPNDVWTHIIEQLDFNEKMAMQQTCRLFHGLLANPTSASVWGRLELMTPRTSRFPGFNRLRPLSSWVQRRLKGISTLYYDHERREGPLDCCMPFFWRELVEVTASSGIRLRLSGRPFAPLQLLLPPSRAGIFVQPPAWAELAQRLTALDIRVTRRADVAIVCSLSALRHLQMDCRYGDSLGLLEMAAEREAWQMQLSSLRTLQLIRVPPAVFFVPGAAACLQQLHSLRLDSCSLQPCGSLPFDYDSDLPDDELPAEMLHLQSLSRLDLQQLPVSIMPDLRSLPALQMLVVLGVEARPNLDVSKAKCNAELKAVLMDNPFGGASGLTKVVLHEMKNFPTRKFAEAIERLPSLKVLCLDMETLDNYEGDDGDYSDEGVCRAHARKHGVPGRCCVKPSSEYVDGSGTRPEIKGSCWPDEDW